MKIGVRFGGPDRVSIRLLDNWPGGLYVGDERSWEELRERCFRNGAVQPRDPIESYFAARVRNYAHVESLHAAEIRHAVVDGECHAGLFVNVADAASWVKWFRGLTHHEYAARVFGRDFGFPPYSIECSCGMSGLIPGTPEYGRLNAERKLSRWLRRLLRR